MTICSKTIFYERSKPMGRLNKKGTFTPMIPMIIILIVLLIIGIVVLFANL